MRVKLPVGNGRHPKPRSHRLLTLVVAGTLPSPCQAGTIFFPQLGQTTLPHSEPVCGRWGDTNNDKAEVRGAGSFLAVWRCTGLLGNYIKCQEASDAPGNGHTLPSSPGKEGKLYTPQGRLRFGGKDNKEFPCSQ